MHNSFGIWITGLPASGKSTITAALKKKLAARGTQVEILESDAVRRLLTPEPTYSREERELFYRALAYLGSRFVARGIPVIFDATANRRRYRDVARSWIPCFLEVAIECPLEVCERRDQKGTYRKAQSGESRTVPGIQDEYEPPANPEVRIQSTKTTAEEAADIILAALAEQGVLPSQQPR